MSTYPDQTDDQRFLFIIAETDKCPVPGSYLAAIGGKPLISYSMEAAIQCVNDKSKMAVLTDSLKVAEYVERSALQPVFLSTERIKNLDWLSGVINCPSDCHKDRPLYIGLISPCFPFITATDIKQAYRLCEEQRNGVVESATLSDKSIWHYHFLQDVFSSKRLFLSDDVIRYGGLRQDDQPLYILNDAIKVFATLPENDPQDDLRGIAHHGAKALYKLNQFTGMSVFSVEDLMIANAVLLSGLAGRDNYV